MVCPRGDDCPYAHTQAEIRHPRAEDERMPDPKDLETRQEMRKKQGIRAIFRHFTAILKRFRISEELRIEIPFQKFKGDNEAEQRRAAYEAILGPGASHVRGIMKRAHCRLQLRGLGCPGSMLLSAEVPELIYEYIS